MIKQLEKTDLNCNIFSAYDYESLTIQELLCEFFTKINECVNTSNKTIDLAKWLVDEGLKKEVAEQITSWISDGTLEGILNDKLLTEINDKVDTFTDKVETFDEKINSNTNFLPVELIKKYDSIAKGTYWIAKVKTTFNGKKVMLKQGYAKGNREGIFPSSGVDTEEMIEVSDFYNASVMINGSACSSLSDGSSKYIGVNIDNGFIKSNATNGWGTVAIKDDGSISWIDSSINANEILASGIKNALDGFMPVRINGKEPSDGIKSKWHDLSMWSTDRHPRTCIGHDENMEYYIFAVFNGRVYGELGFTYEDVGRIMEYHGCKEAICLDGGGSSQLRVNNERQNYFIDEDGTVERKRTSFLYVGLECENEVQEHQKRMSKIHGLNSDEFIRNQRNVYLNERKMGTLPKDLSNNRVEDLNNITETGIYWCTSSTPNSPGDVSYGIIHFQVGNAFMQYAFPYADNGYKIKMRRQSPNGGWGNWVIV